MADHMWDHRKSEVKKSKAGKRLLLERLINYGVYRKDKKKIPLAAVKKNWNLLVLEPKRKKLFKRLIWGT